MLKQGLSQKLLQKLSPQQIQFIQLLQLNTQELEKRVDEEITENPALETEKNESTDVDSNEEEKFDSEAEPDFDDSDENEANDYDDYETGLDEYIGDDGDDYSYSGQTDQNEEKRELPIANVNTLFDVLNEQLDAVDLNPREKLLARHLVGMLEEDGYLRRPLKSIANDLAFLNQVQTDEQELEKILHVIQTFDPPGIGARSLEECLMLQLNKMEQTHEVQQAKKIIHHHMDDLAKKHYDKLMKALKIDRDDLKAVIDTITHLNPKPGESQVNIKAQYIIPDFVVTTLDNELHVSLNSKNAPELRVNRGYQETLKGYNDSTVKNKTL